ncbi:hypothetical protein CHUAL_013582 [Chamberlinius hualienensis]
MSFSALCRNVELDISYCRQMTGVPIWEDFLGKAAKLHGQLKATIIATTAFLDAFQKIADLATNTRGATKEIGTALTRLCLRHKAVEARTKTFTSAIMECLVLPLQDKMEEWKKTVNHLDKEHAKDYKRARHEIKKLSSDTLRLQKKVRKGKSEVQRSLDIALQNVNEKFHALEETEKQALRLALIEERSRFCMFVSYLKPVVDEEVAMLSETSHFQEIMENLLRSSNDPYTLPEASEQIVNDIKNLEGSWTFHVNTPPSSPSSISSRKSSTCSVSSVNSSSSDSTKCYSPGVHNRCRGLSQQPLMMGTLRLTSVSSQDSGFTSQDTLFVRPRTPPQLERPLSHTTGQGDIHGVSSSSSTPTSPYGMLPAVTATWPNLQETGHFNKVNCPVVGDRPHTISTAYERGHQRPPLTIHTFEPLDKSPSRQVNSTPSSPQSYDSCSTGGYSCHNEDVDQPAIPKRALSMSKPSIPKKSSKFREPKPICHYAPAGLKVTALPDFNQPAPYQIVPQPLYVNMDEISVRSSSSDSNEDFQRHAENELYGSINHEHPNMVFEDSDVQFSADLVSALEQNLSNATKYCTIPRYSNFAQNRHPSLEKKHFTSGYPTPGNYATLQNRTSSLRRSSSQTHKPPPPVRRTSSITSQHALTIVQLRSAQSSQNVNSSTSSLGSAREMSCTDSVSISSGSFDGDYSTMQMQNLSVVDENRVEQIYSNGRNEHCDYLQEVPIPSGLNVDSSSSPNLARKCSIPYESPKLNRKASLVEMSVAKNQATLIQSLQERIALKKTPPPQPAPLDRKPSVKLPGPPHAVADRSLPVSATNKLTPSNTTDCVIKDTFIQGLNPKLVLHVQKNVPSTPPPVSPKPFKQDSPPTESRTIEPKRLSFKDELNARLMIQQQNLSGAVTQSAPTTSTKPTHQIGNGVSAQLQPQQSADIYSGSSVVRQWTTTRVPCEPVSCNESLLDQIKRGATLRKAVTNDRSAPKIR